MERFVTRVVIHTATISALVSADACADLAEGACYNDTGVEVAAA